jgi:3-phosphoglycerate kinase
MKTWKIPVTWEVYGTVEIEAETLDEAIKIFDETEDEISLPTDSEYVDASFKREDEEIIQLNNNIH